MIFKKMNELHEKDPNNYWKLFNKLKEDSLRNDHVRPSMWQSHYIELLGTKTSEDNSHDQRIKSELDKMEKERFFNELDFTITQNEVLKSIEKLKNKKSPGIDGILNEMIKCGSETLAPIFTKLFNKILCNGIFPTNWSHGLISSIFKENDPKDPNNYRGLTLCSCFAKLFTSVLNNRLQVFMKDNHTLSVEQIGFRKGARTSDHIYVLKTLIDKYTKKNGKLYACFVDFKKAFDKVWLNGLFYKLIKNGISGNFYKVIKSMYSDVKCSVKINNGYTTPFPIYQGVKQGEILSPALFSLYINDLPNHLSKNPRCQPLKLHDMFVSCLMYADDIVILSQTEKGLQASLDSLGTYCQKWKFEINYEKTKVMIFHKRKREFQNKSFFILNSQLSYANEYKYLGLYVSDKGRFSIDYLIKKARKAMFAMQKKTHDIQLLPKVQLDLFRCLILPIALYGSEIWGCELISSKSKTFDSLLDKLENNKVEKMFMGFSRYILGVNRRTSLCAVRGELGVFPLGITIIRNIFKFYIRNKYQSTNPLLRNAFELNRNENGIDLKYMNDICKLGKFNLPNDDQDIQSIIYETQNRFENKWRLKLNKQENNKLRTYNKFKQSLFFENYLNLVYNKNHRQSLTRLRVSSHTLRIETGRFISKKDYLAPERRICQLCDIHETEDELHFLFTCKLYSDLRIKLFKSIDHYYPNLKRGIESSKQTQLLFLLSSDGPLCRTLSEYCYLAFNRRRDNIFESQTACEISQHITTRCGREVKPLKKLDL